MTLSSHKILIAGPAKSGTTALFFRVINSMPADVSRFFETQDLAALQLALTDPGRNLLAKFILPLPGEDPGLLGLFTHKILLLRDPRDIVVSSVLYSAYEASYHFPEQQLQHCLDLLVQKEQAPQSISLLALLEAFHAGFALDQYAGFVNGLVALIEQMADSGEYCTLQYEKLIRDDTAELSDYLGFPISTNSQIDNEFNRVTRTKGSGSWKDWFTAEDVTFYKPLFNEFLSKYAYARDWQIHQSPVIAPQHASGYVRRIVNERRQHEGLPLV